MNIMPLSKTPRALATATALLLLLSSFAAKADIIYQYSGMCRFNCDALGLGFGTHTLFGEIHVDEAAVASGIVTGSDITHYDFQFGDIAFNQSNSTVAFGLAATDDVGFNNGFYWLRFQRPTLFGGAANTGALYGLEGWTARDYLRWAAGPGAYRKVSEPDALLLLGAGLLALGLAVRRRGRLDPRRIDN